MIPVDFLLNLLNNAAEFSRTGNDLARSLDRAPSERSSGMLGPIGYQIFFANFFFVLFDGLFDNQWLILIVNMSTNQNNWFGGWI